jgi:D-alanyl-D-alanine carboxypeptidase
LVAETAAGQLLPGVHRCLLRVETPHWPEGWTAAGTTHRDDRGGLDPEVAFRIASVTKMMTATALLVLADQGHCRLDDPTGQYLPGEVVDRFHDSTGRPYAAAITLRQLLDHTSGLPNFFSQPAIEEAVRQGGGRRRFRPADLVELAVAGEPPTSPPGTARAYTDTGFLLAGLIIQALTGRPLQAAYRELVLDPAGMADTWLESSDEPPRRHDIAPHEFEGQNITGMDPTVDWAGGGLVSTAADLAAFLRALTRGRLVSSGAWSEMTRWQPGPEGYYDDYGLGLGRYRFPAAQVIGHHGVWAPSRSGLPNSTPSSPAPSTPAGWTVAPCWARSCARSPTDHDASTGVDRSERAGGCLAHRAGDGSRRSRSSWVVPGGQVADACRSVRSRSRLSCSLRARRSRYSNTPTSTP